MERVYRPVLAPFLTSSWYPGESFSKSCESRNTLSLRRTVSIHAFAHQYVCPHQTMDRIPTHQPNKRGIPVGVPDFTAVCRIHGSEEKYSENQTSTHQRPKTARRQGRQRRIGQSSLTSRLFASGLQSSTDFRYADRNQLPVQSDSPLIWLMGRYSIHCLVWTHVLVSEGVNTDSSSSWFSFKWFIVRPVGCGVY
jgi:hypothetical protein